MSKFRYMVETSDQGLPIKQLLRRRFSFSSRMMTKLKKNDCVFLNGEPIRLHIIPNLGDTITVNFPDESSGFPPEPVPILTVYEDDDLLVINKPAGYVVHPTKGHLNHTIANGLTQYMMDTGQVFKIRFINRLDMDTSGLLLIAKNAHCQENIIQQMKADTIIKKYVAIVQGIPVDKQGTIDLPIGKAPTDDPRRGVVPDGYPSKTHYRVLESYAKGYSLVELRLETGRTHQIRVHMSHIGHPIAGDPLYGIPSALPIQRQALHATQLSFQHPITKKHLEVHAQMPEDMEHLLAFIRSID